MCECKWLRQAGIWWFAVAVTNRSVMDAWTQWPHMHDVMAGSDMFTWFNVVLRNRKAQLVGRELQTLCAIKQ